MILCTPGSYVNRIARQGDLVVREYSPHDPKSGRNPRNAEDFAIPDTRLPAGCLRGRARRRRRVIRGSSDLHRRGLCADRSAWSSPRCVCTGRRHHPGRMGSKCWASALISPTDPIAVIDCSRKFGHPRASRPLGAAHRPSGACGERGTEERAPAGHGLARSRSNGRSVTVQVSGTD